jgi:hypothetical protein
MAAARERLLGSIRLERPQIANHGGKLRVPLCGRVHAGEEDDMEQSGQRTIQVPRYIISGMIFGPLLPGFMVLMNSIDNPRLHGVRGPDVLRLIAIGLCAGVVLSGLMLLINSKGRRSEQASSKGRGD